MGLHSWKFIGILLSEIFLFHGFCYPHPQKASQLHYTFVRDATSAPVVLYYDYIIIGGGTSGCPLAATLSKNATVLVLERGGSPYGNSNITNIGNFVASLSDTSPNSPSQLFISEDGVYNTRARVLGGGSSLNAGFYTHAGSDFVKEARLSEKLANASYKWVEKKIAFEPTMLQWQSAVRDGLIQAGCLLTMGLPMIIFLELKLEAQSLIGMVTGTLLPIYWSTLSQEIFLFIYMLLHSRSCLQEENIVNTGRPWPRPRAYGVTFEDKLGIRHTALLNRNWWSEIILSAGAIGSPQLLMLSGIGPAYHLRAHGIPVVFDQPMVGQGMADNPMNLLFVPSPIPVEISLIQVVGITQFGSFIETASGLTFGYSWAQGFIRDYELSLNKTGQQSILTPEAMARAVETVNSLVNATLKGGVILEKVMGPRSTGDLKLKTTNPYDNPTVKFNYFKDPLDLKKCVKGMKTIIDVINSKAFSKFRYRHIPVQTLISLMANLPVNLRPRHVTTAISLEQFCIDTVMTIWHYHGGCQIGKVIDRKYRVRGVNGLRVIDGSTFLRSPGTNPQATVMMLGRYMGRRMMRERISKMRTTINY
ncbi:hypothetical protein GH714_026982 [Hevea brasiliensis]|uniref:Glucose-methanol-choline oxidoreductase N-terminal domain-containing protein n=1 Tax=Hevea brasiliensis TaxID=3981 RepID=A0A6A6MDP4_HEVBR|nr:hypothetical protein GH714_026982 [Hevea brasiliensis]